MPNRDKCPAAKRECYNCDIKGHFGRVCKKPPRPRNGVSKMIRVAERHRGKHRSHSYDERRNGLSTRWRGPVYIQDVPRYGMHDDTDIGGCGGPSGLNGGYTLSQMSQSS